MKLLIITQKVNRTDPVLGFFHRWLIEFSKHFELITVICLEKGEFDLPGNVKVLSLGKEEKQSRLQYLMRFYSYVWKERRNYGAVLSHMNQEYVLLAGLFWKILGKRIYMWRNHYAGDELTDMAAIFCEKIFCTSRHSYTAKYKKTVLMPVGIDTNKFSPVPGVARKPRSILSIGRIAPSKRLHVLVEALALMKEDYSVSVYGDAALRDMEYFEKLKKRTGELGLDGKVTFHPGVSNETVPAIYSAHDIFVNLSPSGMYDKTIFEAMACGTRTVVSNKDLKGEIDDQYLFEQDDHADLGRKLDALLRAKENEKARGKFREYAESRHSLKSLAKALAGAITR